MRCDTMRVKFFFFFVVAEHQAKLGSSDRYSLSDNDTGQTENDREEPQQKQTITDHAIFSSITVQQTTSKLISINS